MTPREFALLEFLMRHRGDVVSKRAIIDNVWDMNFDGDDNIVEVYVGICARRSINRTADSHRDRPGRWLPARRRRRLIIRTFSLVSANVRQHAAPSATTRGHTIDRPPSPRFSIVVPCYNEADYIGATLSSLRQQTYDGPYEIIVVDNNCTDATADIARDLRGPGGARARIRACAGPASGGPRRVAARSCISADADTTYDRNWLATIDRAFGADERVVAVAGPCRYVGASRAGAGCTPALLFGGVQLLVRADRTYRVRDARRTSPSAVHIGRAMTCA